MINPMIELCSLLLRPNQSKVPHILIGRRYLAEPRHNFIARNAPCNHLPEEFVDQIFCRLHITQSDFLVLEAVPT